MTYILSKHRGAARTTAIAWLVSAAVYSPLVQAQHPAPKAREIVGNRLREHVQFLADDRREGRQPGTAGHREAAAYLTQHLQDVGLSPVEIGGAYEQACGGNHQNILAVATGAPSATSDEMIIVCAHYDHVGRGTPDNSPGPWKEIHNGADDNARRC